MLELRDCRLADGTRRDILIGEDGKIKEIWPVGRQASYWRFLNLHGCYLLPALADTHVHSRSLGGEYKESWDCLEQAALCGGVIHVAEMPNTVELVSTNPFRLLGMGEKRGKIEVGYQADLIGITLDRHPITDDQMAYKCGWTPYHGVEKVSGVGRIRLLVRSGEILCMSQDLKDQVAGSTFIS